MPGKARFLVSEKDDLVWQKLEEDSDLWFESIRTTEKCREVGNFMLKYKHAKPELMHTVVKGCYNVVYRLEFEDRTSLIMRVPIKGECTHPYDITILTLSQIEELIGQGIVAFADEKVLNEVATMQYVAANTTIPIPHIHHYGTAAENPTGLGPFIIMDYIEHRENMTRALLDPNRPIDERPVLDPEISQHKLELLYGQMANVLLQLSSLDFPRIGSLSRLGKGGSVSVDRRRPWIMNMNELIVHTNMPPSVLPAATYNTAREWHKALVDMHMAQLALQYNDTTENEDDTRDKYVARKLFRRLLDENNLRPDQGSSDDGFKLFSQDLRPTNVLIDEELRIVGVIDWEFAYSAPAEFSFDPPWWLLLLEPESWPGGYKEWMKVYEPRLQTFLRVLEAEEKKNMIKRPSGTSSLPENEQPSSSPLLSQRMRRNWEDKYWMINYALRDSWAFDFIWWKFLDEQFFGPNDDQDHRARLHLLSPAQKAEMDRLVATKEQERSQRKIFEWDEASAAARLATVLGV